MPASPFAKAVVKKLVEAGHVAYFAGGWVRDYLMKRPSDDIDIATSASVEEIQALFPKTIPVGVAFGIVIVVEGGHQFEVATFRKDSGYVDGRRPTSIEKASPQEDAKRRDFTINGMFWDPLEEKLYDFVKGQTDLNQGIIRAIGDPHERFLEDRLRMMRAVRYATRFNFSIESATEQAIISHAKSLLPAVAMERVWQEFKKMARFSHFDKGLIQLHQFQLLPVIFPQLKEVSLEEIKQRLRPLEFFPEGVPAICELMELFPSETLEQLLGLCDYLKLSNEERASVTFLHRAKRLFQMPQDWLLQLETVEWVKFYADPHAQMSLSVIAARLPQREDFLAQHQERQNFLSLYIKRVIEKTPRLSAEHLMAEGIRPGKTLGALLKEAERININQGVEDRGAMIALLKKSPLWNTSQSC